jgi:hypothetical protein
MSEQAIETEDEIEIEETNPGEEEAKVETKTEEVEEVEIVVEGEEEPTSKTVPKGIRKRFKRFNEKISAANTEADEARKRAEMLEEENKLLRAQALKQEDPLERPDEDKFDTRKEYLAALDEYETAKIAKLAQEQAAKIVEQTQTQTSQAQVESNLNQQIDKHYERSAELKVKDYFEVEGVAADILGDDISKQIIANTEESHLLMYHLGKNPGKAERLKELVASNPMRGVLEIGRLAGSLKVKPKSTPAPDPETLKGGGTKNNVTRGPKGAKFE